MTGRRALTHVGGASRLTGDPGASRVLAGALDVVSSVATEEAELAARAHVHGFHSYPARMHPLTARRLVEALAPKGGVVLDPFCGSGTVLVEARAAGFAAVGVDANPLAARLASLKVAPFPASSAAGLVEAATRVRELADARRTKRAGASRRLDDRDVALFDPHVLLEVDSLRQGLDAEPHEGTRAVLELVLSSILVKISKKAGDSAQGMAPRRIAAGYPARLFLAKTTELVRLAAEAEQVFAGAPPARVRLGDARELAGVADASVALVVTSPPYPGVFDYLAHHEARLRWLRLDAGEFEQRELGSKRALSRLRESDAFVAYARDVEAFLAAQARVLARGGRSVLLIADGSLGQRAIWALPLVQRAASRVGLRFVAAASQARPHFHGPTAAAFRDAPREEHAILIERP